MTNDLSTVKQNTNSESWNYAANNLGYGGICYNVELSLGKQLVCSLYLPASGHLWPFVLNLGYVEIALRSI